MAKAAIPVDDEVPNEIVIAYYPQRPVIQVGTLFNIMIDFIMAFGQFCVNGEFDVKKTKNNKERFEADANYSLTMDQG
jgi:hypothetical protein